MSSEPMETYAFVYSGLTGVGMGIFRLDGEVPVGRDLAGNRYRGTVVRDQSTGEIDLSFEMAVPAGVALVQGNSGTGNSMHEARTSTRSGKLQ